MNTEFIVDKKTGILLRPGTSDKAMLNDCVKKDYKDVECKDQIVLDLGANIGGFMYRAARDGAKHVISYEPEPNNFKMLKLNRDIIANLFPSVKLEIVDEAVFNKMGEMELSIRPGSNASCSCSITRSKMKAGSSVKVKVESFKNVLDKYKPTFIKIDVEGAEYEILEDGIPEHVRHLAFEFHVNQVRMQALLKLLQEKAIDDPWTIISYEEQKVFDRVNLATGYLKR